MEVEVEVNPWWRVYVIEVKFMRLTKVIRVFSSTKRSRTCHNSRARWHLVIVGLFTRCDAKE
jgi:hypothetical protein